METAIDLIWQSRTWDKQVGRGSYCVHAALIPCGVPDALSWGRSKAAELLRGTDGDYYIDLIRDGRVVESVSA